MSVIVIPGQITIADNEALVDLAIHVVDPDLAADLGDQEFNLPVTLLFDASPAQHYQTIQRAVRDQIALWGGSVPLAEVVIPGWREVEYDQGYSLILVDDFTRQSGAVVGELGWELAVSSTLVSSLNLIGHYGALRLEVTANTGFGRLHHGLWSMSRIDAWRWIVRTPTALTRVQIQVGLGAFTNPGSALMIEHNHLASDVTTNTWDVVSRVNDVFVTVDSGLPVLTNSWYEFTMARAFGDLAEVTLTNLGSGATQVVSNVALAPVIRDAQLVGPFARIDRGLAGASRSLDVDYFSMAIRGLERI